MSPSRTPSTNCTKFVVSKARLRPHSKSRSGCLKCKARKVKCREEKPQCSNCKKIRSQCVYPDVLSIAQLVQQQPVEGDELQAWKYFVDNYADTNGIYYYGETKGSWLEQIPARGLHFPSLKSAILAFSSSCAGHTRGVVSANVGLNHRRKALQHLSGIMSRDTTLTKTDRDAVLTTCLILRFQSFFLDDGYVDMLTLRRMTHSMTRPPETPGQESHHKVRGLQNTEDGAPIRMMYLKLRPEILEAADESIEACARFAQDDELLSRLCSLMIATIRGLQTHPLMGAKCWSEVYMTVLNIPSPDFQRFIDTQRMASRIVLAHYLALLMIVTAVSSAVSPQFGGVSLGKAAEWIEHVCWGLPGQRPAPSLIEWPLRIALLGQRARGDDPATLDDMLATLTTNNSVSAVQEQQNSLLISGSS